MTKFKMESRVNIIKPIRFLQGTVVKETENSLKDCYGSGLYKEALTKKILEIRPYLKQKWESSNASNVSSNDKPKVKA